MYVSSPFSAQQRGSYCVLLLSPVLWQLLWSQRREADHWWLGKLGCLSLAGKTNTKAGLRDFNKLEWVCPVRENKSKLQRQQRSSGWCVKQETHITSLKRLTVSSELLTHSVLRNHFTKNESQGFLLCNLLLLSILLFTFLIHLLLLLFFEHFCL